MATREQMIEDLLDDWLNSVAENGGNVVTTILRQGFVGYDNMPDDDILSDWEDAGFSDEED